MRFAHFILVAIGVSLIACSSDDDPAEKPGPWECVIWTGGISPGGCSCAESVNDIRTDFADIVKDTTSCTGECCVLYPGHPDDPSDHDYCECQPEPCPENLTGETVADCNTNPF